MCLIYPRRVLAMCRVRKISVIQALRASKWVAGQPERAGIARAKWLKGTRFLLRRSRP